MNERELLELGFLAEFKIMKEIELGDLLSKPGISKTNELVETRRNDIKKLNDRMEAIVRKSHDL